VTFTVRVGGYALAYEHLRVATISPRSVLAWVALIFGVDEGATQGQDCPDPHLNALRGHELARAVWGWSNDWRDQSVRPGTSTPFHVVPFNGVGTFHQEFGGKLPAELPKQLDALKKRLG